MTTQEFISKNFGVPSTRERRCSSVYANSRGDIFSYGPHYPLIFKVAGKTFINVAGYSNTTAKHIAWAKAAVEYDYIPVELDHYDATAIAWQHVTDTDKLKMLHHAAARTLSGAMIERDKKKRKDTQVYAWLQKQVDDAAASLNAVVALKAVS